MAKQKPTLAGAVRIDGKVYTPGMEEELGGVLTKDQAKRLVEKGVITGVELPKDEPADKAAKDAEAKAAAERKAAEDKAKKEAEVKAKADKEPADKAAAEAKAKAEAEAAGKNPSK